MMKFYLKKVFLIKKLLFLLFAFIALPVIGQTVVTGVVKDDTGSPIPGANVVVRGAKVGVAADIDGKYEISVPSSSSVLVVSFVGCTTKEVSVNGRSVINIILPSSTKELREVVVTALGIKREKKSLGYSVQDVKSDELTKAGEATVTDALQGKVAGLQISSSGTGAGGSQKIVIRGNSSLADNNDPLWVVDGVPYDNSTDTGNYQYGGYDRAGGAFDLNPDDIESISVLKGPAAAALYGSRAGNGVILVTTKKGGKNGRLGITYTGKMSVSPVAYSLDMQNIYGQGTNGVFSSTAKTSWGAKMDGSSIPAWWDDTKTTAYSVQKDVIKNFYNTGNTQSHSVSFAGGDSDNPFRLSLGYDYTKGNVPFESIKKTSFDYVSHHKLDKYLDVDIKANYVNTAGRNRPLLGYYSTMYYLYTMPRNIQLSDLNNHKFDATTLAESGVYTEDNWATPSALYRNPYFLNSQDNDKDVRNRFFGFAQFTVNFTPELKLKLKQGMDYADTQYQYVYKYKDAEMSGCPQMSMTKETHRELNSEFLLTYNKQVNDFSIGLSAGGNRMHTKTESLYGNSGQFSVSGAYYLSLGTAQTCSNTINEKEINSLYGFADLGYKDYLYLDLTARNDWSSTLPAANRSYFYPSVSLSGVVTSALDAWNVKYNKNIFTYGKVRASFAQVGKDTDPYQLQQTYSTSIGGFGYLYASEPTTLSNINLKPEIATSYEFGTEWRLFKDRFGLDFTYYNTVTKNQVLNIPYIFSAGYESQTANVGKITNKGIEMELSCKIINTKDFNLDATANIASNRTRVTKLDPTVSMYQFSSLENGLQVVAVQGDKLGEIYDYGYKRDVKGNKIIGSDGLPEKTDSQEVLGCIQPDFTGSFGLNANYKGIFLSALFTFQKGGDIYSFTEASAANVGVAKCTADRSDRVVKGVLENGSTNTTSISAQKYWQNGVTSEQFIYDASYLKLGELTVGYDFPKAELQQLTHNIFNSFKVSLFGSNLLYLVKHTPGTTPDGSAMSSNIFSQAVDFSPVPNTRTFGVSLNLGF